MADQLAIVAKQLEYYNARDIEGFVSTYSPDIEIYNITETEPYLVGHAALRERYAKRFETVGLHAAIANRMQLGDFIIDLENITGVEPGKTKEAIAIYLIENGLIRKVWFVR